MTEDDNTTIEPAAAFPRAVRETILPRIEVRGSAPALVPRDEIRYEDVGKLGAGGVGEVLLCRDNDIHRPVAMKRLLPDQRDVGALIRFIEEIQTIGQLEHPGIVPIHDVGIDEMGRYFFIMKYAQGETLEAVIEKLAAGDPAYHRRYSFAARVQIFVQVLRAVQFAHDKGFVHRDLKPANIMVGAFGEVLVMDWGLAKRVRKEGAGAAPSPLRVPEGLAEGQGPRQRLFTTQRGQLLGTPAYMSPEQASGHNDQIDERSDIYSLTALLHELLTLTHYLSHKESLHAMIFSIISDPPPAAAAAHPAQDTVPVELMHFVRRGMQKDPALRFQSIPEMIDGLMAMAEGHIQIQCPVTGMRRAGQEYLRFINAHPLLALLVAILTLTLSSYGGVQLARHALQGG